MFGYLPIAMEKVQRRAGFAFLALVVALVLFGSSAARAQNSWSLRISEKELKLENPTDMMWDKWLMWDIGYQRMICRNMPYLELINDAASTGNITEFNLTIGDNRFNFGAIPISSDLVMLGSTTPGFDLSASKSTGVVNTDGDMGDVLKVAIGNGGLLPGQMVRFQINLDVDPSFAASYAASFGDSQPDFRTIFFDMNGNNVYDGVVNTSTDDNAQGSVVFNPGGPGSTAIFEDETVPAGEFFNSNLRPYKAMDPVLIFELEGELIPEPGSVTLAMLCLGGFALRRGSRRRHN
jgi:hypothetical protein